MKHSSTWYALILIALVSLPSAVKNASAADLKSHRTQHHQTEAAPQAKPVENKESEVPFAIWQATVSALRESIADNKQQTIAAQKQAEADKQTFCSPAVVVNEILAAVGVGYLVFMYLQWSAIDEQARIARASLTANRIALNSARRSSDAAKESANIANKTLALQFRPHLIVRDVRLLGAPDAFHVGQPLEVSLSIVNKGSGDATIITSYFVVRILPFGELPHRQVGGPHELPEFQDGDVHYFESQLRNPIIEAGMQTLPISKQTRLPLNPDEVRQLKQDGTAPPSHAVWAIGMIFYRDSTGRYRKTGFCRKYMTIYGRFMTMRDPELEYTY
jgi:hypothetical protein